MNSLLGKKLQPKQRIAVLLAAFGVVAGVIFVLVIFPTINDIQNLRDRIISQKVDLEKKLQKENNMARLGEQLKKIRPEMERFENIFVKESRKLEFITTMEGIADKNNVNQQMDIRFSDKANKNYYSKIPVKLSLGGSYRNLMQYLVELETLDYAFNIDSIKLSAQGGGPARSRRPGRLQGSNNPSVPGNMSMTLSATTYWR